jgi:hypothetical protein
MLGHKDLSVLQYRALHMFMVIQTLETLHLLNF